MEPGKGEAGFLRDLTATMMPAPEAGWSRARRPDRDDAAVRAAMMPGSGSRVEHVLVDLIHGIATQPQ